MNAAVRRAIAEAERDLPQVKAGIEALDAVCRRLEHERGLTDSLLGFDDRLGIPDRLEREGYRMREEIARVDAREAAQT